MRHGTRQSCGSIRGRVIHVVQVVISAGTRSRASFFCAQVRLSQSPLLNPLFLQSRPHSVTFTVSPAYDLPPIYTSYSCSTPCRTRLRWVVRVGYSRQMFPLCK